MVNGAWFTGIFRDASSKSLLIVACMNGDKIAAILKTVPFKHKRCTQNKHAL